MTNSQSFQIYFVINFPGNVEGYMFLLVFLFIAKLFGNNMYHHQVRIRFMNICKEIKQTKSEKLKHKFTDTTHLVQQLLYHKLKISKNYTLETLIHYICTDGLRTNPYTDK